MKLSQSCYLVLTVQQDLHPSGQYIQYLIGKGRASSRKIQEAKEPRQEKSVVLKILVNTLH